MSISDDLLREIKEAAHVMGIAPTTLCQRAVKAGGLVKRLEQGGTLTTKTVEEIRAWIETHRPQSDSSQGLAQHAAE